MGGTSNLEHDHQHRWFSVATSPGERGVAPYLREFEESLENAREAFREVEGDVSASDDDDSDTLSSLARDRMLRAGCNGL